MIQAIKSVATHATDSGSRAAASVDDKSGGGFAALMDAAITAGSDTTDAIGDEMRGLMAQRGVGAEQTAVVNTIFLEAGQEGISAAEAKTFLRGLTNEELKALQAAHSLADPIQIDSLSDEGAVNLLLPQDRQLDVDDNGLVEVGICTTFRMPPPNAPAGVRQAWEEVTEGLSFSERMMLEVRFMLQLTVANARTDSQGNFFGFYEPDDPQWVNPYAADSFSWRDQASDFLDSLEFMKDKIPYEQYTRETAFFRSWDGALERYGVA